MSLRFEHHGALVNPNMGLAEDQLHSPVGLSQCHIEKTKSRKNQPQREANTSKTKNQTKTPETQNRHCDQGQLSGQDVLCNAR